MELTLTVVKSAVEKAFDILEECCPTFKRPTYESINFCNRKSAWAYVHRSCGKYSLYVSKIFGTIKDEELFNQRLVGCMIHEAIHTQEGCMNHKTNFKRYASQVNAKYPIYKVQRCTSMDEYGCDRTSVGRQSKVNWVVKCNHCGKEYSYKRRPKYLEGILTRGTCPICKEKGFCLIGFPTPNGTTILRG